MHGWDRFKALRIAKTFGLDVEWIGRAELYQGGAPRLVGNATDDEFDAYTAALRAAGVAVEESYHD